VHPVVLGDSRRIDDVSEIVFGIGENEGRMLPGLEDMLKFEGALVAAAADGNTIQVSFAKDIEAMLLDIAAGRLPGTSSDCETVLEIGVDPTPFIRVLDKSSPTVSSS